MLDASPNSPRFLAFAQPSNCCFHHSAHPQLNKTHQAQQTPPPLRNVSDCCKFVLVVASTPPWKQEPPHSPADGVPVLAPENPSHFAKLSSVAWTPANAPSRGCRQRRTLACVLNAWNFPTPTLLSCLVRDSSKGVSCVICHLGKGSVCVLLSLCLPRFALQRLMSRAGISIRTMSAR